MSSLWSFSESKGSSFCCEPEPSSSSSTSMPAAEAAARPPPDQTPLRPLEEELLERDRVLRQFDTRSRSRLGAFLIRANDMLLCCLRRHCQLQFPRTLQNCFFDDARVTITRILPFYFSTFCFVITRRPPFMFTSIFFVFFPQVLIFVASFARAKVTQNHLFKFNWQRLCQAYSPLPIRGTLFFWPDFRQNILPNRSFMLHQLSFFSRFIYLAGDERRLLCYACSNS
jgi:hypothetical protein